MTSFKPTISRLRIEAFRGFRDVREFDLSASAVVVTGPNGTGKTSFFDALQWVLLGKIERLESLRARKNVEHIVSQYRSGRKAVVEIDLELTAGTVSIRRSGDQSGSTLELFRAGLPPVYGDQAERELHRLLLSSNGLTLEDALTTSGLMQQDVLRSVLEARPAERFKQLSTILGLGRLEAFEEATKAASAESVEREKRAREELAKASEKVQWASTQIEIARARLVSRPQIDAVRAEVFERLARTPRDVVLGKEHFSLDQPEQVREVAAFYARRADEVEVLGGMADRLRDYANIDIPAEGALELLAESVEQATVNLHAAEQTRARAQSQLNSARKTAADVAKLAASAIPMLSDKCPVCSQTIDASHVEQDLLAKAEASGTLLELEMVFTESHNVWVEAGEKRKATEAALSDGQRRERVAREAADLRSSMSTAALELYAPDTPVYLDLAHLGDDSTAIAESARDAVVYLRSARQALHEFLEVFDRQAEQSSLERAQAEFAGLQGEYAHLEVQFETASERARKLKGLAKATVEARVEVTDRRLRSLQPLVADIYHRLDPHPAFKTVDFELDTYYRRGTTSPRVVDSVADVSADPLLVLSTSQANIVALSYFLAMSLSMRSEGLPFLLLDDPVQSMDDVNVLGFADLCRHLREDRQLIVSTHERRLSGLLERKLAPRQPGETTRIIRFTGWDRSGPSVDEKVVHGSEFISPVVVLPKAG